MNTMHALLPHMPGSPPLEFLCGGCSHNFPRHRGAPHLLPSIGKFASRAAGRWEAPQNGPEKL